MNPGKHTPPAPEAERLQKVLAKAGLGSRRAVEEWIEAGRVTVNGEPARLGDRVGEKDIVKLDGRLVRHEAGAVQRRRVLIYNKPEGEICSRKDPEGRPTVFDQLPSIRGGRWVAVGRLDFNTCGLMLFTSDGELANALMHPSRQIEREYLCRVMGEVDDDMLDRLRKGVLLEDGMANFSHVSEGGGTGINRYFYVVVKEGRNREVRRLWESQGVTVSRLKRVRFGPVVIPSSLRRGKWEELNLDEVNTIAEFAGLEAQKDLPDIKPQEKLDLERQQRKKRQWQPRRNTDLELAETRPKRGTGRSTRGEPEGQRREAGAGRTGAGSRRGEGGSVSQDFHGRSEGTRGRGEGRSAEGTSRRREGGDGRSSGRGRSGDARHEPRHSGDKRPPRRPRA